MRKKGDSGIKNLLESKKGKLYFRFVIAAALIIAALFAYSAFASAPASAPVIVNNNGTTVDGALIPNASIARAADKLFFASNFTMGNGSQEENSTFKWFKRSLYLPQNRSLVGYWKLDGNANGYGIKEEIA